MSDETAPDPAPAAPCDPHRLGWQEVLRSDLTRFLRKRRPSIGETETEILADRALARVTRHRPGLLGTDAGRAVVFAAAKNLRLDLLEAWSGFPPGGLPHDLSGPPAPHDAEAAGGPSGPEHPHVQEFWVEIEPILGRTERAVLAALRREETNTARIAAACNVSERSVQRARRALKQKVALAWRAAEEKLSPRQLCQETGASPSGGRGRAPDREPRTEGRRRPSRRKQSHETLYTCSSAALHRPAVFLPASLPCRRSLHGMDRSLRRRQFSPCAFARPIPRQRAESLHTGLSDRRRGVSRQGSRDFDRKGCLLDPSPAKRELRV